MDVEELKNRLANLTIWKRNGQRAPHKPLLVLYALAQLQREQAMLPYKEVKPKLTKLLAEFGPPRAASPEQPFVRLTGDGIWHLSQDVDKRQFTEKQLLMNKIEGGFQPEVLSLLQHNTVLIAEVAEQILQQHFAETMHADILEEIGLELAPRAKIPRDPHFRERILRAYEYSCAICGFNVRLGSNLVAVDAAHIRWHQSGGPDVEDNGIALCSLHHKLFDRGVFTITEEHQMLVSEEAYGNNGFEEWLMRYHGSKLRRPIHPDYKPRERHIQWHFKEVFRSPARTTAKFQF
ncbi:phosphorothioated DNA-binding restriction endonuclease [Paenibacillus thalictri]|uniref:Restriction endonuclease n=1 Tax=Paenibacillus thalictri TaxID=2527873 RepID=A0A4Q9DWY0_9BACL|nr:HNH endonuclease [Paenibacillus thalictri]TBL80855.1 restriction endonuclease [Paenibacillus thalictri]